MKKGLKSAFACGMALFCLCSGASHAWAENTDHKGQEEQLGSLTLYKYDMTGAEAKGAFEKDAYVSTGRYEEAVNQALDPYAIQGVEFTYLKVGEPVTLTTQKEGETLVSDAFLLPGEGEKGTGTERLCQILDLTGEQMQRKPSHLRQNS